MKMRNKKELFKQLENMEDFRRHREQIVYPQAQILFMSLFCKCGLRYAPWITKR
jgi:hypothetical protein